MAGHAARHRVDAVTHFRAVLLEQLSQFAHRMLGLGHRHAVAGYEDHGAGRFQQEVGVVRADGLRFAGDRAPPERWTPRPEAAEEHVAQGAVHGLAHDLGQDDAARADQRAGHDEHVVQDDEARGARRQPE